MSTPTINDLGVIISNSFARKFIYGAYVVAILIAGGVQIYFAVAGDAPAWFAGVNAVLLYLGVPVGTLAAANTAAAKAIILPADTTTGD